MLQNPSKKWEVTQQADKYYQIEDGIVQRKIPLWDQNIYNGWRHIFATQPITQKHNSVGFVINQYGSNNSGMYFGVAIGLLKQHGQSCGLGGPMDQGCISYNIWNEDQEGTIRVNGQPCCQPNGDLFVPAGSMLQIKLDVPNQIVIFHNTAKSKSVSIKLSEEILSQELYVFTTLTHKGDKVEIKYSSD